VRLHCIEMEIIQIYQNLLPEINQIQLIDTHEHLLPEPEYLKTKQNFFNLFFQHYASSDLISAGMDIKALEYLRMSDESAEKKWIKFFPFWQNMENTTFARVLKIAAKDLFNIDEISKETVSDLCKQIQAKYKPGWYDHVLREKAGIKMIYVRSTIANMKFYPSYFLPIVTSDQFLEIKSLPDIAQLEDDMNIKIHTLKNLTDAIEKYYTEARQKGAIGIKMTQAYKRSLSFKKRTFFEAESIFNKIFYGTGLIPHWNQNSGLNSEERKPLVDFLMHTIVRMAGELGLVVQIHTGFQEGQGNYITNANPTLLTNLFLEYSNTRFDILHCGFPYHLELACLAKNCPNVYPNMTWIYCIGSTIAGRILSDWFDIIPINKILGFGGDYHFVEGVYGHAQIARQTVTRILSEKIAEGLWTEKQAMGFGQKLFSENAEVIYNSDNRGDSLI